MRQIMYEYNNEVHSHNHCCWGKGASIKYYKCMSVALDIQHAQHMCIVTIYGLSGSTISFHITS